MKALANSWAFSRRIGPLIGMLLPRIDVNHFSKASFNFSYVPVFTLCHFSDAFWKASKVFSLFFFQVARVLPRILNWFAKFFWCFVLYFQIHFAMLSFCSHFTSASSNRIQTNLRISKHSNIMGFELKHSNLLQ